MIDLHSHTTASDGQYPPAEQVALAARAGVTVLAVTDHDTVAGLPACAAAAAALGLRLVPGIELSAFHTAREVHVLGHFVDPGDAGLTRYLAQVHGEREGRMAQMVEKLVALGFPLTLAEVQALAGGAPLTRPHLARAMVERGWCSSTKDAFDRFLGDRRPAWVPRLKLSVQAAVDLIHGAGGTATLAHPGSSKVDRRELGEMRDAGLDGLEVVHLDHPPSQREKFLAWTRELSLVPTAGSDFHGERVAPGKAFGAVGMAPEAFARLEALSGPR